MKKDSKKILAALTVFLTLIVLIFSTELVQAEETSSLSVKLIASITPAEQADVIAQNGGVQVATIPALRIHVIEVPAVELQDTLLRYQSDPEVESAEVNMKRKAEGIPSDPYYTTQWALPQIGWDLVFPVAPGGTATVAVLDTGVDSSHTELAGKLVTCASILDGSDCTSDPHGHGTWLAGIVAASTDNSIGIAGVAYSGVSIMPVTVLGSDGTGLDSDIIQGVIWAADNGADVILMGFSNPGFSQYLQEAIDYAWTEGVVLVAPTGNDSSGAPRFPAGDRGVIGVSATDEYDNLASFSNYGNAVFLAAPGTDIATTDFNNDYVSVSGTSSSSAIVAGIAAFMKAVDPGLTNGAIVGRLARMAEQAGTQEQTGNGRVDMARALTDTGLEEIQPAGAAPVGDGGPFVGPYVIANKNLTITFAGTGGGTIAFSNMSNSGSQTACTATCGRPNLNNFETGTLTVTPNDSCSFTGWSGSFTSPGTTTCTGTASPCNFSMGNKSQNLTATFAGTNQTYYQDADSDGYGNPNVTIQSCSVPAGYVLNNTDCNDSNAAIKPGATEICDDVDNNCTAGTDEGCDDDNDNYCDSSMTVSGTPSTCTAGGGDCNDSNSAINPVATETCDNIDNDCDGPIDENLTQVTTCGVGQCSGNTGTETCTSGSWGGDTCNPLAGASAETCDGIDNDCDAAIDEGVKTTYYRDADSDTYGDPDDTTLACSAPAGYVSNNSDNCPDERNPDQRDVDSDTAGDVCDVCPDDNTDTCNTNKSAGESLGTGGGTLATNDGSITMVVPADALSAETSLSITGTGTMFQITTDKGIKTALFGVSIQPDGTVFNTPVTITFSWSDADNNGIVDGTSISENYLIITKDNVVITGRCWEESGCGTALNKFSFQVSSLSDFTLSDGEEADLVTLTSFAASRSKGNNVLVTWETATEIDCAGFNVYRSVTENGGYTKLNNSLIACTGDGSQYKFIDKTIKGKKSYYYELEDIDLYGVRTLHGPVYLK